MPTNKMITPIADLQHQYDLLRMEYEYEKETYREQSERIGIHRKIQQGFCWYPIQPGRSYYNSLNQLVVEIVRTEDKEAEHNFEYGRPVCFFTTGGGGIPKFLDFSAVISYVQDDRMVVVLPSPAALAGIQGAGELGVQLYFDETSYKTMFAALSAVMKATDNRLASLRDVLLGRIPAGKRTLFPVRFPWLNVTQEEAVNHVLAAKEVAIVHGPPGTGKTTTLVEAIYETLHRENQVMVCAQSNTAVDWIAEKLLDRGVNVLRIGNPTRINDKMLSFTYERRFEAHPDYPELWKLRKTVREMAGRLRKGNPDSREAIQTRLTKWRSRITELEININEQLFSEARVIASTLVGTAGRVLERKRFTTLFIDESAQALEAACWIAISRADRVILAGDHCQLPPTIKCIEAARGGLDRTLLQKVTLRKPEVVSMLNIQYRMNEEIMHFPSAWFYHDELQAAPEVRERGILAYDTPMVWTDTAGQEFYERGVAGGVGRINTGEAELLAGELKRYMEKIGEQRILDENIDFGVISPYRAQVRYLRQMLKQDAFFRPFRRLITIHTVDGFQGQERDVIFISLVRANEEGQIGFLNDLRRMNVAITRARMKLVILGDSETLTKHPFYKALYEYIEGLDIVESPCR